MKKLDDEQREVLLILIDEAIGNIGHPLMVNGCEEDEEIEFLELLKKDLEND